MTLIATYVNGQDHVIIGDLLISADQPNPTSAIPTRQHPSFPPLAHTAGIHQKICCVNSRLAVAWAADDMDVAERIITTITNNAHPPYTGHTPQRIGNQIQAMNLTQTELDQTALMFWMLDENNSIFEFCHNCKIAENPDDSNEYFIFRGSGSEHFFSLNFAPVAMTEADHYSQSIARVMARIANALYRDVVTDEAQQSYYGAGFEAIVITRQGFIKVPLTFVFWLVDGDDAKLAKNIPAVFSYLYDATGSLGLRTFSQVTGQWVQNIVSVQNFCNSDQLAAFDPNSSIHTPWSVHFFLNRPNSRLMVKIKWGADPNLRLEWDGKSIVRHGDDTFQQEFENIRAYLLAG